MSVYRPKGSSRYYFEFWYQNERFYGSTGTDSEAKAKEVEAAEREKARRAHFFPDEVKKKKAQITVDQAFERYYTEVSEGKASAKNHMAYMARMLKVLGKDKHLSEITDADIADLVARRRGQKARYSKHLVSNATVNRETELLSRIFKRAKKVWKVDTGDDISWEDHKLHEADERVRELTPAEEKALFANLREDLHPMTRFALICGMRLSNVIRLTWRQVDFEHKQIVIKMKSKKPGGRTHIVPISAAMLEILQGEQGKHPVTVFTYTCKKSRAKRRRGEVYPISANGWRKGWAAALKAAGIEDFRFHDTRHTAATRLVRQTRNLKLAQSLLGHASISSTTRYAHVTKDDLLQALDETGAAQKERAETPESRESPKVDKNAS